MKIFGAPVEFILFGLMLAGIGIFHRHTLCVSLIGLVAIVCYKLGVTGFESGSGLIGLVSHLGHEWVLLTNLLLLLVGFALVSDAFEKSHLPAHLPEFLPHDWKGGFGLLVLVWVLSSFLDNIAGGLIGGAMAHQVFRGKVHVAFVAAIVAASNAGGAWSVVGDTTTTMMWIAGISPARVLEAFLPAAIALFVFGIPAALKQQKYSPILKRTTDRAPIDWVRVSLVAGVLILTIAGNVLVNLKYPAYTGLFPFIGVTLWVGLIILSLFRAANWSLVPGSVRGAIFLLALVTAASLMPVRELPDASWQSCLALGFLSSVFDNIPLTALALKQGGYDWGFLAYSVGFGGSMIWFGSSSGIALCGMYKDARSVTSWLRHGWWIIPAYVIGFFALLFVWKWHPDPLPLKTQPDHSHAQIQPL